MFKLNQGHKANKQLPFVAIIIVHWANIEDTVECLESLSRVDYPRLTIILVNNNSNDFDEIRLRHALPEILIVTSNENLGFAGGNNLGITRALAEGADLVFLLNNDTTVEPDLIWSLLPAIIEPEVGIVGPVITFYHNKDQIWFAGGVYSRLAGYSYRRRPLASLPNNCPVDWINGCALLAKREVFESIGLLWESLFLYCEDLEFCLRATQANYRCVLVGKALVHHKVSSSSGTTGSDQLSPDKAYYFARNYIHLIRRDACGLWILTGMLSQFALILPFYLFKFIQARDLNVVQHYLAGLWDGIRGRQGKRPAQNRVASIVAGQAKSLK